MRDVLAHIYAIASEEAGASEAALARIATLAEIALRGPEERTATTDPTVVGQVRILLQRHEWERIVGFLFAEPGLRCPVCGAQRSRGHRAGCWLRQVLLLLSL